MLKRRWGLALALPILFAACAGGPPPEPVAPPPPPPPPQLNPVGTYDLVLAVQGMTVLAELRIEGTAEAGYTGFVDSDMGSASVTRIAVDGQELTFQIPDAGARVRLEFDGDNFTGSMSGDMGDAAITGSRRR